MKYLRVEDIVAPFILLLVLIPAILLKLYLFIAKRPLWVVSEGRNDARDNGFTLFEYIRTNYPATNVHYAINKKSHSIGKVASLGNVVHFGGLKHWLYYIAATKNIVIHKSANPNPPLFYVLHRMGILNGHRIFLQHGVTMNDVNYLHYNETKFELFICAASPEFEYVKENFGFPESRVAYLGFSRFDKLFAAKNKINNKQIVIMPTWRSWLGRETNALGKKEPITESRYFKTYQSLITNKKLIDFAEKNELTIYFFQHANMEKYTNAFKAVSPAIKIVDSRTADIQELLAKSGLMITDYSSVSIDFAFMKKPLIYYQFDESDFRKNHLKEGYFSYRDMGFGPVLTRESDVIPRIIKYVKNNLIVESKYQKNSNNFFALRDGKNSERIFQKLRELEPGRVL